MRKILASLDVGSSSLKLIVGEVLKNRLNVITSVEVISRGIKNGYIVNLESATEALKELFAKAEDILELPIKKVITTVPSYGAACFYTEGVTTITNADKIISNKDVTRAIQASVYNKVDDNQELISILPTGFVLNDVDKTANPIGLKAEKLIIKAVAITIPKNNIEPVAKCLEAIGVEIIDVVIGPLGDYYEFASNQTSNDIGAIINIGRDKTEISIFNKGILTATNTLDLGGSSIDSEISFAYKINVKEALYLKETLGVAHKNSADPEEYLSFDNKRGDLIRINQLDLSDIIYTRLVEMLNLAKKQINTLTKRKISYIIVTGGLSELKDFNETIEEVFDNKAMIGEVFEMGIRHNKYSSSAGLIKYYNHRLNFRNIDFSIFNQEEEEELSGLHKKITFNEGSILGKLFGQFFDS